MKTQQNQPAPATSSSVRASFGRRLGAIVYDLLLVTAIVIFAAVPFVLITGDTSKNFWTRSALQLYLLAVIFLYYGWFWTHGGQTLGLLTWKLRLVAQDGGKVTWRLAMRRFAAGMLSCASFGIGLLWALVDRDKLAWHDRLSRTRLIQVG
jgi:uncharacterized RDD family membrane protein YckC